MRTAKRLGRLAAVMALLAIVASTTSATTYVVQPDGLGDYPTIQAAVLAATDGDIIELADGTFTGDGNRDIQVPSKHIVIQSQSSDYNRCIIDCGGSAREEHRGFRFHGGGGSNNATLENIAIINGYVASLGGGGIITDGANPTITNCAVAMCTVEGPSLRGGGLWVMDGSNPNVYFCLFAENTADYGGGVAVDNSDATLYGCQVTDNVAGDIGGGMYIAGSSVAISYCTIVSNEAARGGGVRLFGTDVWLANCDISRNDATVHSGGVWLQSGWMDKCTLAENSAPVGGGVYGLSGAGSVYRSIIAFSEDGHGVGADDVGDVPYLQCCDVYGNAAGEYDSVVGDQTGVTYNFSADPEFCDFNNADYRLFDTSPCLASVSPCGLQVGHYDQACDSPVEDVSWGMLKAMWR